MSFTRAFPKLKPQSELDWLDSVPNACDDDLRYCTSICRLIAHVESTGLMASCPVTFRISGRADRTTQPWLSVATRILNAVALTEWNDPMSAIQARHLRCLIGVFQRVLSHSPCMDAMAKLLPDATSKFHATHADLQLALEWHVQLTGLRTHVPLQVPIKIGLGIDWSLWRQVLAGMVAHRQGQYSEARRRWRAAEFEHQWDPIPADIKTFLATPREDFEDAPKVKNKTEWKLEMRQGIDPLETEGGVTFA